MTTSTAAPRIWMSLSQARRTGLQADVFTVDEFAAFLPADGSETKYWESIGHARGDEQFHNTRMRRGEHGIEILGRFDGCPIGTTQVICVYPLGKGRTVRVLTRKP